MNFKEWFEKKLTVGSYPFLVNKEFNSLHYGYVLNMSDEFYNNTYCAMLATKPFWFPMNERKRDIGLNSIYGAMVILWQAEKQNEPVYLHCHSGRNRSQIVRCCYYYLRTGEQLKDGDEKYYNRLHRASVRGYLPPMSEMEEFLRTLGSKLIVGKMNSKLLDECKLGIINNF